MKQCDFVAVSQYTGPSEIRTVVDDPTCPWVTGKWDGINVSLEEDEIKRDIDGRVALLAAALRKALPMYKTTHRYFVAPEFYFRCQQGPYPDINIGALSVFDYLKHRLKKMLKATIPADGNTTTVVIGSVLSSNIDNYDVFLSSDEVIARQAALNGVIANGANQMVSRRPANWVRSFPLMSGENNSELGRLNEFMNECRADPLCTVRNRGIWFECNLGNNELVVTPFIYEKQNESTVDLTMGVWRGDGTLEHGGMITEWMGNYPSYSILKGDKQIDATSTNARFQLSKNNAADMGVEICLDHRLQRLRRTVDMCVTNGAAANNYPIACQLIPSGGMQILDYAVAADCGCPVFNADGCDKIYGEYGDDSTVILKGESGTFSGVTCGVYTLAAQSKWASVDGPVYSHSQLAFTMPNSALSGFNNAMGQNNLKAITFKVNERTPENAQTDAYTLQTVPMNNTVQQLFTIDKSELHCYSPIDD